MLDALESGDRSKFRQMAKDSQWDWFIPYFDHEQRVDAPLVKEAGPLKLAVELSRLLRLLGPNVPQGTDTLVVGELRKVLEEFHKIPSMENIGLTSAQYTKQVVAIANYTGIISTELYRMDLPKLVASYLLSSVDSSWCLVWGAERTSIEDTIHHPMIGVMDTKGEMHHIWVQAMHHIRAAVPPRWGRTNLGNWGDINDDDDEGDTDHSVEVVINLRSAKTQGMVHNRELLRWERSVAQPSYLIANTLVTEAALTESGFSKYLPGKFLSALIDLVKGIGTYIDWHCRRGHRDPMPLREMPEPPMWLSVSKYEPE